MNGKRLNAILAELNKRKLAGVKLDALLALRCGERLAANAEPLTLRRSPEDSELVVQGAQATDRESLFVICVRT